MRLLPHRLRCILTLLLTLALVPAIAAQSDEKPFAEKKEVLQISDEDAGKRTQVLNVAGPDRIDVEIVAFGPGLRRLFANNSHASPIESLSTDSGVRFSACENTTRKVTAALGHTPQFNP